MWSWTAQGSRFGSAPAHVWALGLLAGVVGFAVPFVLWSSAANQVRPAVAAIGLNLIPVIGVASAAAFGRGAPSPTQVLGGGLIVLGLVQLTRDTSQAAVPAALPEDAPAARIRTADGRLSPPCESPQPQTRRVPAAVPATRHS
jgi:hypothetical protein